MTTFLFESCVQTFLRAALGLVACILCGCREAPQAPPMPAPVSADLPSGIVATFHVSQPEQLYAFSRAAFAPTLPRALPVLLTHVLGLPADISGRFRTERAVNGALAVDNAQRVNIAIGLPVTSGRELIAELTLGARAPFQAHPESRLTELRGASIGPLGAVRLGVSGNLLIVADSMRALRELGPYLASHTEPGQLASELTAPGIALRSVARGAQLQGLLGSLAHDAWNEAADSPALSRLVPVAALHEHPLVREVFTELVLTFSAYLGHLEASDATLVLDGSSLDLAWDAKTSGLPTLKGDGRTACRDLASLPEGSGAWLVGAGRTPDEPSTSADWEILDPAWQQPLVRFLATVTSEATVLPDGSTLEGTSANSESLRSGSPWLLSWYDQGAGASLLGIFRGISTAEFDSIISKPHQIVNVTDIIQVTRKGVVREGKPLEVAWTARGTGVVSASGAPLGTVWTNLAREPEVVQAPDFLSHRVCEELVAAAGYSNLAYLAVSRTNEGLRADGSVDLRALAQSSP